ncbi:hypothetical protein ABVF61_07870 [Roseibium sp. HPY-6]|uniref:hypothetical protein n=1 Tax=Roseibium sp. HPY-6 TaxID=3229852 RepID=UPI00339025A8
MATGPSVEYFLPKNRNDPSLKDNMYFFRLGAYDASREAKSAATEAPEGLYCYSPDHYTLKATGKMYETVSGPVLRTVEHGDYIYDNVDGDLNISAGQGVKIQAKKTVSIVAKANASDDDESTATDDGENFSIDAGENNLRFVHHDFDSTTRENKTTVTLGNKYKFVLGAALTGLFGHSRDSSMSFDVKLGAVSFSAGLGASLDWKANSISYGETSRLLVYSIQRSFHIQNHKRSFLDEEFTVKKYAVSLMSSNEGLSAFEKYVSQKETSQISIETSNTDLVLHDSQSI